MVRVSNPSAFTSLKLSGGGQSVKASAPGANTLFTFAPISLPAKGSLIFSLNAATNSVVVMGGPVAYADAGMSIGLGLTSRAGLLLVVAFLIIGLTLNTLPVGRRRKATLIATLALARAAAESGCGGGSNHPILAQSSQTVTAVSEMYPSGNSVEVTGLPAPLGTISIR